MLEYYLYSATTRSFHIASNYPFIVLTSDGITFHLLIPSLIKQSKGKVLPVTGHEGAEGYKTNSWTLPLTAAVSVGWWLTSRPGRCISREKEWVPILQETEWPSESVWTGTENVIPTGIRSPDR